MIRQERHHALDLLRGMAAIGVAIYHWLSWNADLTIRSLGTFGVYVFFVLSALTMAMVYERAFGERIEIKAARNFYRNRAARLLPLLALVAAVALVLWVNDNGWSTREAARAILTGSGAFALTPVGLTASATASWSVGIELAFYAVVPVAVMAAAQASPRGLLVTLIGLLVAQQLYLSVILATPGLPQWDYYAAPLTFAPFFAAGFLIFRTGEAARLAWLPVMLALFGALACWSLVFPAEPTTDPGSFLALSLIACTAVFAAYRAALPTMTIATASFIGNISYAMYLTHPFTNILSNAIGRQVGLAGTPVFVLFLVLAVIVSSATYWLFEAPARDWLRGRRPFSKLATLP